MIKKLLLCSLFVFFGISTSFAQDGMRNVDMMRVGGEPMSPQKNIIQNAVNSKAHTTLVAAIKAADLVETLANEGPFTVFAPTNDAFENLPEGTVETLLMPENKERLVNILTYHVVPGTMTYEDLAEAIEESDGRAEFSTVSGDTLVATWNGEQNIVIIDENGNVAHVSTYDVMQSNGVIHVIDAVLLPGG